jgi:5-methyltetrahydrofolate--homocysteine methyltransferase
MGKVAEMEKILKALKTKILVYDGAFGTMLQGKGLLTPGVCPEELCLTHPNDIIDIHRQYIDAGANVIETNTFGASSLKLQEYGIEKKVREINTAAVKLAKEAAKGRAYIAGSIGPLPKQLEPLGDLTFDDALKIYAGQAAYLEKAGADLLIIETMSDIKEAKAAVIAAKSATKLPVQAQMTFEKGKWTVSGTPPEVAAVVLGACGADIVGANCSSGPEDLLETLRTIGRYFDGYISVLPNAGLPELVDGKTVYKATPEYMADYALQFAKLGVNLTGGCCGTNPDHIRAIAKALKNKRPAKRAFIGGLTLASRTRVVRVAGDTVPLVIGERINPTNRKDLFGDLSAGKMTVARNDAVTQVRNGAAVLDINMGAAGLDEAVLMKNAVANIQNTVEVPIAIDTTSEEALEIGLKEYAGKPLINSVNGKAKSIASVIPLAAKYGAALIGLTIDEKGIPKKTSERIAIAKKIVARAEKAGIKKEDILIDCLTLTVSSEPDGAKLTIQAIEKLKELGLKVSLGVSNISFGLPNRKLINSSFLSMAVGAGLDGAIINPNDVQMMDAFRAASVLANRDRMAANYIAQMREREAAKTGIAAGKTPVDAKTLDIKTRLHNAILFGERDGMKDLIAEGIGSGLKPFDINMAILVPALEEVGRRFEKKEYFLPQLILAADTMRIAFESLKAHMKEGEGEKSAGKIVIATVEGDVHDIGKNIVVAVLENYGFTIIDLGKNVSCKEIVESAKKHRADIVGLSALMTTTMTEMEKVTAEIKKQGLPAKTVVGGAVITPGYARKIGADGYAKDAVAAVKVIRELLA